MVEAIFFREVGVFIGDDVLFQWRGTLSVGLTRARGARGFEGDQLERTRAWVVMNINESHHSASP